MLTTSPRLRIRRPSPTTIEYTLSTRPPPGPLTTILYTLVFLARILLLSAVLLPCARLPNQPGVLARDILARLGRPAALALASTARLSGPVLAAGAAAAVFAAMALARVDTTESVLVLRGLGIQTRPSRGGAARFIPTELIRDVLVNEVFVGFEVRFCLVVVVEGEEDMVVLFPRLMPRKDVILKVWRGIRTCLFDGEGDVLLVSHGKV